MLIPGSDSNKKTNIPVVGILPQKKGGFQDESERKITESLYKQNLELTVKNKTLSLLRQLYQISILALEPSELGDKIVKTIRSTLEYELAGIFLFDEEADELVPLKFDVSDRLKELHERHHFFFDTIKIINATKSPFFSKILQEKVANNKDSILNVWEDAMPSTLVVGFKKESHIKTTLGYPLIIEGKIIGVFVVSINREYNSLSSFEKDSLLNFVDVTAVALDRARLYVQLKIANEKLTSANNRLKELDQLKSEFVSLATHQIRAPLTAIKGYISLVQQGDYGPVSDEVKKALDIIMTSTNNLVTIVGDFLDVSRIEQGRMKYEYSNFDLRVLAEEVANEYKPNIEKRGLSYNFSYDQSKNYIVDADKGKVRQIIGNVIDNSIKYTPHGKIEVFVTVEGENIRIKISDTGVGISPGTLSKLFQKFSRADNANQTNTTGTGLGMYIAKNMMDAMGGKIWAESEGEGKGSQFYIELKAKN